MKSLVMQQAVECELEKNAAVITDVVYFKNLIPSFIH